MMVEYAWVANIVCGALISILGWIVKSLYSRITVVEDRVQDTRERYTSKDDIKEMKVEINRRFDEIKELILYKTKE